MSIIDDISGDFDDTNNDNVSFNSSKSITKGECRNLKNKKGSRYVHKGSLKNLVIIV